MPMTVSAHFTLCLYKGMTCSSTASAPCCYRRPNAASKLSAWTERFEKALELLQRLVRMDAWLAHIGRRLQVRTDFDGVLGADLLLVRFNMLLTQGVAHSMMQHFFLGSRESASDAKPHAQSLSERMLTSPVSCVMTTAESSPDVPQSAARAARLPGGPGLDGTAATHPGPLPAAVWRAVTYSGLA